MRHHVVDHLSRRLRHQNRFVDIDHFSDAASLVILPGAFIDNGRKLTAFIMNIVTTKGAG